VESDVINRNAVDTGFRAGNARKNVNGALFRSFTQRGLFQDVSDVFPGIMGMMFMTAAVAVIMLMFV
jgi:hypothetical protein